MNQRPTLSKTFLAGAWLSIALTISALAQPTKWKEYSSEKGKYSVLLPGAPTIVYGPGDAELGVAVVYGINYQEEAKAWSVDYFDLPAIQPDTDAIKQLLERRRSRYSAESGSGKSLTLNGYPALEFKMRIADRDRVRIARIILVKQRVYELWVVTFAAQASSDDVTKFFDSFKPIPLTDEEAKEAIQTAKADKEKSVPRKIKVSGGVLRDIAIKKVQPSYPAEAKAARVSGAVNVRVLISEAGNVMEAEVIEGPEPLREAALNAARMWVFKPTELSGAPVKVEGTLVFNFTLR